MPIRNVRLLRRPQAKIEGVRGVAESNLTRWLYPLRDGFEMLFEQELDEEPELTGSYHAHSNPPANGRYTVRFNYEERVTFEDLPWWLQMILKGGVAGVTTGSTPPGYTYGFTPDGDVDNLATFSMVAAELDNLYTFNRCAVNRATFRWDESQAPTWHMAAEIWAQSLTPGATYTGAVAERDRESLRAAGTTVFLDEPGGTIGTTPLNATVRSGSITIDNQLEEKFFSEQENTVDDDFGRGEQLVTGELLMEFKNDAEFAKARSATSRKLRIQRVGSNIGASPTTDKRARFDVPVALWRAPRFGFTGQNRTATFGFIGYRNAANPAPIVAEVVNALATLP